MSEKLLGNALKTMYVFASCIVHRASCTQILKCDLIVRVYMLFERIARISLLR